MNLKEAFEEALPFHYTGSTPDENGNHVDHFHEFEHDGNTYRVQHRIFEPNAWGDKSASVSFEVKPKGSDKFTTKLTSSSSPFKVLKTVSEISERMQKKHGFNSLTASAVYEGGNRERRAKLYQRAMERLGGGRPVENVGGSGVLRITNESMDITESIVKRGDKWVVMNSDKTRILGKHKTEKEARAQLAAIEISKKKRGLKEQVKYRGEFTQRLLDRVKEVKAGGKNPALDIEDPNSRRSAAFAISQARTADQDEVRRALKAVEGGAKNLSDYVQTGNPNPGLMSRTEVSGMEARENLVKKLITYKGKI